MNPITILPSDTPDSTFRCEHFSCTLAFKHCLRRQTEQLRASRSVVAMVSRPLHPFCADECPVGRQVAAQFGKPEPVLLALSGTGQLHRYAPVPPAKEDEMPRGKRAEACSECGSEGTRHKASCGRTSSSPRAKRASSGESWHPSQMSDAQLVACVAEAVRRAGELRARAAKLEQLVAEAQPATTATETKVAGRIP